MEKLSCLYVLLFVCVFRVMLKKKVGLDLGVAPTNGGGGVLFSLEPKYNIKDNINVGLRIGIAAIVRDINDFGTTTSAKVAANGSPMLLLMITISTALGNLLFLILMLMRLL